MVVEVIYHQSPVLPGRHEEEEGREVESSLSSQQMYDMGRDTSHTNRIMEDDTRQSIQTSILNCTGDTEDDDEEIED